METKDFLKLIGKEEHREVKNFIPYIEYIFNAFGEKKLVETEYKIFDYFYSAMSLKDIKDMLQSILSECADNELLNALDEPLIMKFMVMKYIRQYKLLSV